MTLSERMAELLEEARNVDVDAWLAEAKPLVEELRSFDWREFVEEADVQD